MTPIVDPVHAWYTKTYVTPIIKKYSNYGRLFTNSWPKTWTSKYFGVSFRPSDFIGIHRTIILIRDELSKLPEVMNIMVSDPSLSRTDNILVHLDPKLVKEKYEKTQENVPQQMPSYVNHCDDCINFDNTSNYCVMFNKYAVDVKQTLCSHTIPSPAITSTPKNKWIECDIKLDSCGDYCFDHPSIYGVTKYFSNRHNIVGYAGTLYDGCNGEWKLAFSTPLIGDSMPKPLKVRFLASAHPYRGPKPETEITFEAEIAVLDDFDNLVYLDINLPTEISDQHKLKSGKYQVTLRKIDEDRSRPTGKDRNLE